MEQNLPLFVSVFAEEEQRTSFDYNRIGVGLQISKRLSEHQNLLFRYRFDRTNLELRFPIFGNLRGVVFSDNGTVYRRLKILELLNWRFVVQEVASLREGFATEDAFEATLAERGVSEQELFSELRRQLTVTRYLERRFCALAYVTEEEIQSFFDAEIIPELPAERAPTLEEVDQIRRILEEQKFNERVKR